MISINGIKKPGLFLPLLILLLLALIGSCQKKQVQLGQETMGEFAPPDAFLDGEQHPFYGSENKWDRRFFTEHIKNYYKRRGQRQMLDLVEGRIGDTEEYCRELLKADPDDVESLYNLTVALAHQGKVDEAMETLKSSIAKGFPFQRFLAGPRDVLEPLTDTDAFQSYAARFDFRVLHGPMSGRVTDHGASFWVRTVDAVEVQVRASTDRSMRNAILSDAERTSAVDDYTAIVSIDNLDADKQYFYEVLVNGKVENQLGPLSFRTYPKAGEGGVIKIGFGGGAGYVPDHEHMWSVIKSHQPQAFLFMGDNVYINVPDHPNGVHYYTYYRRQSRQEFRDLVSSTASYAIWDDHDAATDDVWLGPYKDKPSWKLPLLEVFRQNWINPFYGSEEWPACWFNFSVGDVEVFMLDGRFYRTNPFTENPTMLGPAQKAWFLDALQKSTAVFKVIASPVPWSYEAKTGAKDTWNGFHRERDEIFDFLAENKIEGVFLLSADRHRSDAWEIDRENAYSLYEFSSSRLTNQHFHPVMPTSLFGYNDKPSFGLLTFNMDADDPTVTYEIVNIDNEKLYSLTLNRSDLQDRP